MGSDVDTRCTHEVDDKAVVHRPWGRMHCAISGVRARDARG